MKMKQLYLPVLSPTPAATRKNLGGVLSSSVCLLMLVPLEWKGRRPIISCSTWRHATPLPAAFCRNQTGYRGSHSSSPCWWTRSTQRCSSYDLQSFTFPAPTALFCRVRRLAVRIRFKYSSGLVVHRARTASFVMPLKTSTMCSWCALGKPT